MHLVLAICAATALVIFVAWGLVPAKSSGEKSALPSSPDDRIIDPSDAYQIGLVIGLSGGSIADAAAARYALQRFEEIHGRKATVREIGIVVGLVR